MLQELFKQSPLLVLMEHLILQHVETQAARLILVGKKEHSMKPTLWEGSCARWQKHSPWRQMHSFQ